MDDNSKGLGLGSAGKNLSKAIKDGSLFQKPTASVGGTGYAPNADQVAPDDDTDDLQKIAEGADPVAVRQATAAAQQANAYNPQDYENRRSQSVVYSQREVTEQQLAEVRARNEAAVREEQRRIAEEKAKRATVKTGVIVFIIILVVAAIALAIIIATSMRRSVAPPAVEPDAEKPQLSTVDGYSCETELCGKVADLPDGRIILRDTAYYIYDAKNQNRESTTIDAQDYNEVYGFTWGGKTYLTLDPNSGLTALYSINETRYVTSYAYDKFYTKISDSVYNDMSQIEGDYIVAQVAGSLKLISLVSGENLASGSTRVFTHDNFFFGYEDGKRIYAYTSSGKAITTVTSSSNDCYFTRAGYLISVKDANEIRIFNSRGEEDSAASFYEEIFAAPDGDYLKFLSNNASYYRIPGA